MNDLVSIIMPSYNTANYIAKSIESVMAQTYNNWELIIVDDCSTDNTDDVVGRYLKDERIRYIKNEKNSGAAVSRNRALLEAKGRWIAFLDSDDLWYPEKLEKQIGFMKENDYHFSYTCYEEIDGNSNPLSNVVTGPKFVNKRKIYDYCWIGCLTAMYDAKHVGLIQINDIKKNNDYAMWLKVCGVADCYLLDEVLAKYRRGRKGSISTHNYFELIQWHYKLYRICDNRSVFVAMMLTFRNLFWGFIKKIVFVKG